MIRKTTLFTSYYLQFTACFVVVEVYTITLSKKDFSPEKKAIVKSVNLK